MHYDYTHGWELHIQSNSVYICTTLALLLLSTSGSLCRTCIFVLFWNPPAAFPPFCSPRPAFVSQTVSRLLPCFPGRCPPHNLNLVATSPCCTLCLGRSEADATRRKCTQGDFAGQRRLVRQPPQSGWDCINCDVNFLLLRHAGCDIIIWDSGLVV